MTPNDQIVEAVEAFYTAKRSAYDRWPELPWPSAEERRAMSSVAFRAWHDRLNSFKISRGTAIGKAKAAMWRKLDKLMEDYDV